MTWITANQIFTNNLGQKLSFKYNDVVSTNFKRQGFTYDFCFPLQPIADDSNGKRIGALKFWSCFSKKYYPDMQFCLNYLKMNNAPYEYIRQYMNPDLSVPPNLGIIFGEVCEGFTLAGASF